MGESKSSGCSVVTLTGTLDGTKSSELHAGNERPRQKTPDDYDICEMENDTSEQVKKKDEVPLSVLHLLPDGRWQELHLGSLELQFESEAEAQRWNAHLSVPLQRAMDAQAV